MDTRILNGTPTLPDGTSPTGLPFYFDIISDVAISDGHSVPKHHEVYVDESGNLSVALIVPPTGTWKWRYRRPSGPHLYFNFGPETSDELEVLIAEYVSDPEDPSELSDLLNAHSSDQDAHHNWPLLDPDIPETIARLGDFFEVHSNVLTVKPTGGDFESLSEALDSLPSPNPSTNRTLILVFPGYYHDNLLGKLKSYVTIEGVDKYNTTVANSSTDYMFDSTGLTDVVFKKITIIPTTSNQTGGYVSEGNVLFFDCIFRTYYTYAANNLAPGSGAALFYNCYFESDYNNFPYYGGSTLVNCRGAIYGGSKGSLVTYINCVNDTDVVFSIDARFSLVIGGYYKAAQVIQYSSSSKSYGVTYDSLTVYDYRGGGVYEHCVINNLYLPSNWTSYAEIILRHTTVGTLDSYATSAGTIYINNSTIRTLTGSLPSNMIQSEPSFGLLSIKSPSYLTPPLQVKGLGSSADLARFVTELDQLVFSLTPTGDTNLHGNRLLDYTEEVVEEDALSTHTIDGSISIHAITLTDDTTIDFINMDPGRSITVHIIQGPTPYAVTWVEVSWPDGEEPELSTTGNTRDKLVFDSYNGVVIDGQLVGLAYA